MHRSFIVPILQYKILINKQRKEISMKKDNELNPLIKSITDSFDALQQRMDIISERVDVVSEKKLNTKILKSQ